MRAALIHRCDGFTLLEALITTIISGIVIAAAFQFYVSTNQQVIAQQQITEMQLISRTCLGELTTMVRPAGMLLDGHPPLLISGDTLTIYTGQVGGIDSVRYFLEEFTEEEYSEKLPGAPAGMPVYKMMRQEGSDDAVSFADYLTRLQYTMIGTSTIAFTIEVQSAARDESYPSNSGYRTYINTERVFLPNAT